MGKRLLGSDTWDRPEGEGGRAGGGTRHDDAGLTMASDSPKGSFGVELAG